ncbi:MAG: lytic transglycosylase domain-containing protein [Deltaproteobacteria bacterium]|nr:lytic transglycosylase domain-containing protein [Deltaproteobacteria bacterium]MBN2671465.1 lytic transglycosylase domain-containing protein [Deltaproteobacteria bacterium]
MRLNTHIAFLIFILLVFGTSAVVANIYSYTDKDGTTHFTNMAPNGTQKGRYKLYMKTPEQRQARPGVTPVAARDTDPARYTRYDASIKLASHTHSIPEAFIRAVIRVESDYDPRVVSVAGAQGLMQLMPATAKRMGCSNSFDPHQNIMGGTRYLRHLANLFNGDMVLTIAGYHAGEGAVRKYSGVPPYKSTHGYISKVLKYYYHFKKKYGTQ